MAHFVSQIHEAELLSSISFNTFFSFCPLCNLWVVVVLAGLVGEGKARFSVAIDSVFMQPIDVI